MDNQYKNIKKSDNFIKVNLIFSLLSIPLAIGIFFFEYSTRCVSESLGFFEFVYLLFFPFFALMFFISLIYLVTSFIIKESSKIKLKNILTTLLWVPSVMILSSLIFISSAQSCPAYDALLKSNMDSARVAAKLWYDGGGNKTYSNVCNSPDFKRIGVAIKVKSGFRCFDSATDWCAEANLVTQGEWCADSTGYAGSEANCSADNIKCQ